MIWFRFTMPMLGTYASPLRWRLQVPEWVPERQEVKLWRPVQPGLRKPKGRRPRDNTG